MVSKKVAPNLSNKTELSLVRSSAAEYLTFIAASGQGGVEAVYATLAVYHQKSPPTINLAEQDIEAGCDLDYCANEARDLNIRAAISNSFGFGGTNGTLVIKRFSD